VVRDSGLKGDNGSDRKCDGLWHPSERSLRAGLCIAGPLQLRFVPSIAERDSSRYGRMVQILDSLRSPGTT